MRTVSQRCTLFLMVALLVAACASSTGYVVTGESLDALGKTFVTVGQAYNKGLDAKTVTVEQYRTWAEYAKKFQQAYPAAVQLWKSSVAVNDAALTKQSSAIVTGLVTELAKVATVVGIQVLSK